MRPAKRVIRWTPLGEFLSRTSPLPKKNPALPRLLLTTNPQLKRLTQEFLDGYETKLAGLLADARAPGVVRSDLDGEAAATLFIGIIQGLAIRFGRSEELDAQPRADSNRACEVKFIGIEAAPAAHRRAVSFNLRCCVG